MRALSRIVFPGLALSVLASPAAAQQSFFFGEDVFALTGNGTVSTVFPNAGAAQANFLAALSSSVGTETFESGFTNGQSPGSSGIDLLFPGAGTATLLGSGAVRDHTTTCANNPFQSHCAAHRYQTSGDFFFDTPAGGDFRIEFGQDIAAFGFFGVDVGDFGGQLFLDFVDGSGNTLSTWAPDHSIGSSGTTSGSVMYAGYVDTDNPFREVRFRNNSRTDLFAFDDMTIATAEQVVVPEPGMGLLLAAGLFGFGGVIVRRRRESVTHQR